ncbi:MAG TPA: helix-hairpin-helix domain-containing protein [Alicycliphilus sp.]|jgi:DNA transformation protein|uniref:Helix-hairpin-helix domain-containing protein n=1 Tax=Diaphorobacter limosus TaxID=3036128 RepID=A0ABZ0J5X0_9BURK|nr:helix-hairpin-helix domain-containing protein [Diaphorobacter sp. Y-1]MBP6667697.1 mitomycin resistance protein [Ottowia sp.]WOO33278.1 helix-hairpin-helix domain-containing protein [Diaphorobacter sp. Y-1]HRN66377.1 helix-hairpin-helix domain-containing protein [Alicycliphilus sp.]
MPKAATAQQAVKLTDIPNIGPSIAADLKGLGVHAPTDVGRMDPWHTYDALRGPMGQRHDPCVLDVLLAAHEFMNGGAAKPWWVFTAQRKAQWASRFKTAAKGLK